jgi:hypothetical protein
MENFWKALLMSGLVGASGGTFGVILGLISPTLDFAMEGAVPIMMPFLMCSGLFVNLKDIYDWIPYKWTSPFRYSFEGMIRNEYDNLRYMSHHLKHEAIHNLHLEFHFWTDVYAMFGTFVGLRLIALLICWIKYRDR